MLLRHNTTPEGAASILAERCVRAIVDRSVGWLFVNGPFFFVDGHDGGEVPNGGRPHAIDMYFECSLEAVHGLRGDMNQRLNGDGRDSLRGKLLLQHHDYRQELLQQAVIVPDEPGCLRLVRLRGAGSALKLRAWSHKRRRTTFDVGIGSR